MILGPSLSFKFKYRNKQDVLILCIISKIIYDY